VESLMDWLQVVVFGGFWGFATFGLLPSRIMLPFAKFLAPPRLTSFVDRMDLTGWVLGSLVFGMGMVFGKRLFHAPLLFIFVPLFIALLLVGVYLRRTKNVQSSTTAPGPENIVSFRSY
jgi:hypothetical protein